MEKANDDFQAKLAKKEREVEVRTQEKEELLDTVNKMKNKLEKEAASHYDAKQHIAELNRHIEELKAQVRGRGQTSWSDTHIFELAFMVLNLSAHCSKNYFT